LKERLANTWKTAHPRGGGIDSFDLIKKYVTNYTASFISDPNITSENNTQQVSDLTSTGFIPFHTARSVSFEGGKEYRFETCVPDDICAVLNLQDSNRDGFYPDSNGRFNIFLDGYPVLFEFESRLTSFTSRNYYFGSCESKVTCYDGEFNPDNDCTRNSTSLAFELTTDECNDNIFLR
jgi:hypothetical protein